MALPGIAIILAFLAGFVDTAAFIHMSGLFVAHVTGNFVLLGAALATGGRLAGKARRRCNSPPCRSSSPPRC